MATDTENSDVFDLKGEHYHFEGQGARTGSEEETEEFPLSKGLLIWECGYDGSGRFSVELSNGPYVSFHSLAEGLGEGTWSGACRVSSDKSGFWQTWFGDDTDFYDPDPLPENLLEVKSSGSWYCHLFQPALGQLVADFPYRASGDTDGIVIGFFRVGSRPLLLSAQHNGGGEFIVVLMSFDGTDVCGIVEEDGQCRLEECQTEAKSGKEYLLLVRATGTWNLEFTEGY